MLHLSYCDTTQDTGLAQQCHCLAFRIAVCCNQQEKKKVKCGGVVPGAWDWSMGTRLVQRPGPWGETSEQEVPLEPGGLGLGLGLGWPAL